MSLISHNSSEKQISASDIGWFFVYNYYATLTTRPCDLYLYYGRNSRFTRGVHGNDAVSQVVGQQAIKQLFSQLHLENSRADISSVDTQPSSHRGLFVQVIGLIYNYDSQEFMTVADNSPEDTAITDISSDNISSQNKMKHFVQTFFLVPWENGFYVLNSVLRFLN
ncbi:7751_t:CDS:2 [Gigaspora margarita]|uniref:NTF2-domain-containing protein n=2 Tax=Gigaspora margarita TaxID=4874 RepID=A0A8H4A3G7_GIGMA|nr:NTF2-domain-containing protein [Gigaspora margarita]CAG8816400.1 7751_t:CDS:2 [Gigaspora margarita]